MTEGFEEKKWFIYLTDHHEGPFSAAEIQTKVNDGQVGTTHYVWADGMPDWQLMKEVAAFSFLKPKQEAKLSVQSAGSAPAMTGSPREQRSETAKPAPSAAVASPAARTQVQPQVGVSPIAPQQDPAPRGSTALWAGVVAALAVIACLLAILLALISGQRSRFPALRAGVQPVAHWLSDAFPALGNLLSPVPKLEDISPDELRALRAAASTPIGRGPAIAVALSGSDPANPVFYVASNLPDGARIDIYLEGIPDTLLNQLSSEARLSVTLNGSFGKSGVARLKDGKTLPRGSYRIFAVDAPTQPPEVGQLLASRQAANVLDAPFLPKGIRLVDKRTYFLGGSKDQIYASHLKDFHDKVREKAASELAELKQFTSTLESQLGSLLDKAGEIQKIKANRPALRKKAWAAFDAPWSGLQGQLDQSFRKWTPDTIKTEVFYDNLYDQLTQTGRLIDQVHALEEKVLIGDEEPDPALSAQATEASTAAQAAVARLKSRIDQTEKAPPTPGGLPQKEGL